MTQFPCLRESQEGRRKEVATCIKFRGHFGAGYRVGIHPVHRRNSKPGGTPGLKRRAGSRWEPCVPPLAGEQGGGGVWAETTPGSSFLSWPEGAGGEEGHGERGGLEEGRRTQAEGFTVEAGAPPGALPPYSVLSNGPGAGRGPPPFSEVAEILTQEVSAQAQPPQRQHPGATSLSSLCLDPAQVPDGRGGRGISVGSPEGRAGEVEVAEGEKNQLSSRP